VNAYRKILPAVYNQCGVDDRYYDHEKFMLCWNVKIHKNFSFEEVFKKMCTPEFEFINEAEALTIIPSMRKLESEWGVVDRYEQAIENMQNCFLSEDTYNFVSPDMEKKYSVTYPNKGADCKWGFMGRSGGWLVLREFMGCPISQAHVSEWRSGDPAMYLVDNWRLPYLLAMMEEVTATVEHRHDELLYQLAFQMRYNMTNVIPE